MAVEPVGAVWGRVMVELAAAPRSEELQSTQ
jgi:hypothetical protein